MPVLGTDDIEEMTRREQNAAEIRGDAIVAVEIQFGCAEHSSSGLRVFYEDGVIVIQCMECDQVKGQIEVAQHSRVIAMEYKN
jgi:hypothetical protein